MFDLTQARVLLCVLGPRELYRKPLLSPHEIYCAPQVETQLTGTVKTLHHDRGGEIALDALLEAAGPDFAPDVLIVKADASGTNHIRGIAHFPGPRLLIIGDTHHLDTPLRRVVAYARSEPFDAYVISHTPHHARFLAEAGLDPLWNLPGLEANHCRREAVAQLDPRLAFVGSLGPYHFQRRRLIAALERAQIPLRLESRLPEEAADVYAEAAVSLNVSLNGDLNLRNWEVLSAGGLLLTDRLAPESGFERWFEEGVHYLAYGSPQEAIEIARRYIQDPEAGRHIRKAGYERLWEIHDQDQLWRELGEKLANVPRREEPLEVSPLKLPFYTNLAQYEWVQEQHRRFPQVILEMKTPQPVVIGLPRVRVERPDETDIGSAPWQPWDEGMHRTVRLYWAEDASELQPAVLARFRGEAIRIPPEEEWPEAAASGFRAQKDAVGIFVLENPIQHLQRLFELGESEAALQKVREASRCWLRPEACLEVSRLLMAQGRIAELGEVLGSGLREFRTDQRLWQLWCGWLQNGQEGIAQSFQLEGHRWGYLEAPPEADAVAPVTQEWLHRVGRVPVTPCPHSRKILLMTNMFPPQELGGYGRMMWEFAAGLVARGHEVRVLTTDLPQFTRPDQPEERGRVPTILRTLGLYGDWEGGKAVVSENMDHIKKIVRSNMEILDALLADWPPDIAIVGNLDFIGVPVVERMMAHGLEVIHCLANKAPGYPIENMPNSPRYHLAPCSDWNGRAVIAAGYPFSTYDVVYPGARTERFYQYVRPGFGKLRICYASLVMPYKGAHLLINALDMLHRWGIPFECEVAGDSTDPGFIDHLREQCDGAGFGEAIKFIGFLDREGLAKLFMRSNVLVFPSVFEEPFGISQVEAMAAGLVVVTSATGGASEIIQHGLNGIHFKTQDAAALARQLAAIAENPAAADRLSRGAQMRAEEFNVKRSVERLEALIGQKLQPATERPNGNEAGD